MPHDEAHPQRGSFSRSAAKKPLRPFDKPIHGWFRFPDSLPPQFVRAILKRFDVGPGKRVLDPFCGTGTVLVECKKLGIESVGVDPLPLSEFAATTKLDWSLDPARFLTEADRIAERTRREFRRTVPALPTDLRHGRAESPNLRTLSAESREVLPPGLISPLPLHKSLLLREQIESSRRLHCRSHALLALATTAVCSASNRRCGCGNAAPSCKHDPPIVRPWLSLVSQIADDISELPDDTHARSCVYVGDARRTDHLLAPRSVDAVLTALPALCEDDDPHTIHLPSALLGLVGEEAEIKRVSAELLCTATHHMRDDDQDHTWIADVPELKRILEEIELARKLHGRKSGRERLYGRAVLLYFGGIARHLASLRSVLRPGAQLAYVVPTFARYFHVLVPTPHILVSIGTSLGYESRGIEFVRRRFCGSTHEHIEEEMVLLVWSGHCS